MKAAPLARQAGFSLLEILLAFAIIVVILLIGLGVTQQGRKNAKEMQCINNLRQLGSALFAYANDHHSRIPPRVQPDPDKPGYYLGASIWFEALRAGGYSPAGPFTRQSIHVCPEFAVEPTPAGMEAYGLRRWRSEGSAPDLSQSLLAIENRADFFLVAESYNTASSRQGYCIDGYGQWKVNAVSRKLVKTLFADGHVAYKPPSYFADLHLRQARFHVGSSAYQVHINP